MTLVETARLLALIGARDGWAPTDHHVAVWHHAGTDEVTYEVALDRVLDHNPQQRVSLCCLVGNCDPEDEHAEVDGDPVRFTRELVEWRQAMFDRYGVVEPITERSYALMVKAVGPKALDAYREAVA